VVLGLLGFGAVTMLVVSFALWGSTMRYEVDFASVLIIAAVLTWTVWAARLTGVRRRLVTGGGALLIAWGVAGGMAFGITGYYDGLLQRYPKTYERLEELTAPLPTLISWLDGKPKTVNTLAATGISVDTDPGPGIGHLLFPLSQRPVELKVVSGSARRYGLSLTGVPLASSAPAATQIRIQNLDTRNGVTLPANFPQRTVPISLRRGLNRIIFVVTKPADGAVQLGDVHLAPLPSG
jgi:hypothetical protein